MCALDGSAAPLFFLVNKSSDPECVHSSVNALQKLLGNRDFCSEWQRYGAVWPMNALDTAWMSFISVSKASNCHTKRPIKHFSHVCIDDTQSCHLECSHCTAGLIVRFPVYTTKALLQASDMLGSIQSVTKLLFHRKSKREAARSKSQKARMQLVPCRHVDKQNVITKHPNKFTTDCTFPLRNRDHLPPLSILTTANPSITS